MPRPKEAHYSQDAAAVNRLAGARPGAGVRRHS